MFPKFEKYAVSKNVLVSLKNVTSFGRLSPLRTTVQFSQIFCLSEDNRPRCFL